MTTLDEPVAGAGAMVAVGAPLRHCAARAAVVSRPVLWERLGAARVTVVSAPPGSGKTVLLRSWTGEAGLAGRAAWVSVGRDERDPQRFWLAVLDALRQTSAGSALVRELTAAPDLDGWAIVERLLKDLVPLEERLWLVIDDVHELGSAEARRQLELLVMRAPAELRFVLATRHDVRLGLHRLRLEGELAEIRADDLRFTLAEARELLTAARVRLTDPALALLVDRTEGWAAGLRLAALSLAGHPDPERFAAEFSGSERTVAEYLLAEVLERQPGEVRRLLLRTSVLERVNGELADLLLTGGSGGERILHDLERANAFVVSLDATRSWFRYHRLFAGLLQLQLRRTEPGEVAALHELAAGWLAGHGFPVEAIRHAQAARDWGLAARLLADHWPGLYLDGQAATVHALLGAFPAETSAADAELAALAAADELARGSLETAERYLGLAERGSASVPAGRRGQALVLFGIVRPSMRLGAYEGRRRIGQRRSPSPTTRQEPRSACSTGPLPARKSPRHRGGHHRPLPRKDPVMTGSPNGSLKDKTVLVVGRGSGLARAIALAALDVGAHVIAAGRNQETLPAAYAAEPGVSTEMVDLTDEASIAALGERLGTVDHVVSTASARVRGRIADLDRDAIRLSFDTKVIGPLMLAKHLAPRMNEGGSFVLFSGVAAAKIAVGTMGVAITNAAADTLARSLALELAPIRVNAISPGVIDTGAWDALGEQGKADYFADITARNPARRIGTPEDIAQSVLFALTNTFLTGQTLHIDGGEPLT